MTTLALVTLLLAAPPLIAALGVPLTASARGPRTDHHALSWTSGAVRHERLLWWAVLAVGVAVAWGAVALSASAVSAVEVGHGFGPHAHFVLSSDGVLTARPAGWQPATLLPPWAWLGTIPLVALGALAVPLVAVRSRWRLLARPDGLTIWGPGAATCGIVCRSFPRFERPVREPCSHPAGSTASDWASRVRWIRWTEVTAVYAAGATLHVETRRGEVALRADGAELDVEAVAAWLAAARDQAHAAGAAAPEPPTSEIPRALVALRARARQ